MMASEAHAIEGPADKRREETVKPITLLAFP